MSNNNPPVFYHDADEDPNKTCSCSSTSARSNNSTIGFLRTLHYFQVKFLRYYVVDLCYNVRCKMVPIDTLMNQQRIQYKKGYHNHSSNSTSSRTNSCIFCFEQYYVTIAKACIGGMTSNSDCIELLTGYTAQYSLLLQPELSTLRLLPYCYHSHHHRTNYSNSNSTTRTTTLSPFSNVAMVMCNLLETNVPTPTLPRGGSGAAPPPTTTTNPKTTSNLCCRSLLQRVVDYAAKQYNLYFTIGIEIEFCLYRKKQQQGTTSTNDSDDSMFLYEPVGYDRHFANVSLLNEQQNFINELYDTLQQQDITNIELIHTESANGQFEIVLSYLPNPIQMIDHYLFTIETIKAVVAAATKQQQQQDDEYKVLFLPKIQQNQAGNGVHFHISLNDCTTNTNLFPAVHSSTTTTTVLPCTSPKSTSAGDTDGGNHNTDHTTTNPTNMNENDDYISSIGQQFVEGILHHLPALLAFTIPTVNSFRRIGTGCWTGSSATYGYDDKECAIRFVPQNSNSCYGYDHFEYKLCDATANPYLALACILLSGLDGLERQLQLRFRIQEGTQTTSSTTTTTTTSTTTTLQTQPPDSIYTLPTNLGECLQNLENSTFFFHNNNDYTTNTNTKNDDDHGDGNPSKQQPILSKENWYTPTLFYVVRNMNLVSRIK